MKNTKSVHPRHAELVELVEEYLRERGVSARWLGLRVANDARLVANLKRGQHYRPKVMVALSGHLLAFYGRQLAKRNAEEAAELPLAA